MENYREQIEIYKKLNEHLEAQVATLNRVINTQEETIEAYRISLKNLNDYKNELMNQRHGL